MQASDPIDRAAAVQPHHGQLPLNLEAIRYTLYTSEPILVGVMRLRPGSKFWSSIYIFLSLAQLGAPALAVGRASVMFAAVQILRINTKLLPPEIRPAMWRRIALIVCAIFYDTLFCIQLPAAIDNLRTFAAGS
jgi:hypothetical protein